MIHNRGRQIVGVRYDLIFNDEVMETYDVGGTGGIKRICAKCDRNPGMTARATVYREPEYEGDDEVILDVRQVYPAPDASAA